MYETKFDSNLNSSILYISLTIPQIDAMPILVYVSLASTCTITESLWHRNVFLLWVGSIGNYLNFSFYVTITLSLKVCDHELW